MCFWKEAFHTAVYTINRMPTPILDNFTPIEKLLNQKPDYNFLKTFGCACFPFLRLYNENKLNFHTSKCVFIGYGDKHKGYKCLHNSGRVYSARHVIFNELDFPFVSNPTFLQAPAHVHPTIVPDYFNFTLTASDWSLEQHAENRTASVPLTSAGVSPPSSPLAQEPSNDQNQIATSLSSDHPPD